MDAAAFVNSVISRPWQADGLHCWELTRLCQREVFGRELPAVLVAPESLLAKVRLMRRRHDFEGWTVSDRPCHGAVCFLTRKGHGDADAACHSGTWLALDGPGALLHVDHPQGVAFESLAELKLRNWSEPSFHIPIR
jgi:hypothetical protein